MGLPATPDLDPGRIYFIKGADRLKVGFTVLSEGVRFKKLQAMSPVPLEVVAVIDGVRIEEKMIHSALVDHHSHSEWFNITIDGVVKAVGITARDLAERIVAGKS